MTLHSQLPYGSLYASDFVKDVNKGFPIIAAGASTVGRTVATLYHIMMPTNEAAAASIGISHFPVPK